MKTRTAQSQEQRRLMMANDPIGRVIFKMAVPTIVAFLINSIYSLADTFFVSSLGTNATAAVSVNASLDQLIMMCGSMLAVGSNSYIARLLGEGNEKKASQVLSTAFFSAFAIGTVLLIFGNLFMTPMVRLLGATPTCEAYSIDYASYVLLAAPFMAANFVMNQCLRSEGSATLSMIGMGFGGILNCILDPILILGSEGLKQKYGIELSFFVPEMQVAGFNWGAKRYDRVMKSYRFSSIVAIVGAVIMSVLLVIFVDPIIVLFAGEDPQMHQIGALCILLQCFALPIHSWVAVVNMLCAGLGNAKGAFLLSTSRQGSCMIPILFPLTWLFAEYGLASVQALADILSLALAIPIAIQMTRKIKSVMQAQPAIERE